MENFNGINAHLMEILICPVTHGALVFDAENMELVSETAKLAYPVVNGIMYLDATKARILEASQ